MNAPGTILLALLMVAVLNVILLLMDFRRAKEQLRLVGERRDLQVFGDDLACDPEDVAAVSAIRSSYSNRVVGWNVVFCDSTRLVVTYAAGKALLTHLDCGYEGDPETPPRPDLNAGGPA